MPLFTTYSNPMMKLETVQSVFRASRASHRHLVCVYEPPSASCPAPCVLVQTICVLGFRLRRLVPLFALPRASSRNARRTLVLTLDFQVVRMMRAILITVKPSVPPLSMTRLPVLRYPIAQNYCGLQRNEHSSCWPDARCDLATAPSSI